MNGLWRIVPATYKKIQTMGTDVPKNFIFDC